jgi:hypothetical protein
MSSPLGSWRSWLLDSGLAGLTVPPTVLAVLFLLLSWLEGSIGSQAFEGLVLSSLLGLMMGLVTGPVAWAAASVTWSRPLLTMAIGPVMGSLSAVITLILLSWMMDGRNPSFRLEHWLLLLGLGAFAIGPPWVAYVAVRSKGHRGTHVVLATLIWVAGATALMVGLTWLRHYGWRLL